MSKEYKDYYKNHQGYQDGTRKDYLLNYYAENFGEQIKGFHIPSARILEIGCGKGIFAIFCDAIGFSNYFGFDLDSDVVSQNQSNFKNKKSFLFSSENVIDFMNKQDKFDIIFMSHVFEHLNEKDAELYIHTIYSSLNQNGIYINVMPNAGSLFSAMEGRYADSTHKKLYTETSFHQLLLGGGFEVSHIESKNTLSGPIILRLARTLLKKCIQLFINLLGYPTSRINTFEIITISKK